MQWTWTDEANLNDLIEKLMIFAEHRGYKTQVIGRKRDILEISWSVELLRWFCWSSGLRLIITVKQGRIVVDADIPVNEFVTKGVGFIVGFILIIMRVPVIIAPAYGSYVQYKLIEDTKKEIDDYFDSL
jgi:hypothetical protein